MNVAAGLARILGARLDVYRGRAGIAAASATLPAPAPSVVQAAPYVDDQVGQDCVEETLERLRHLAIGFAGQRGDVDALYKSARGFERARKTDPLPDTGSTVGDAMDAAVDVGFAPVGLTSPDPAATMANNSSWDETIAAYAKRMAPENFALVGDGDLDTVRRWLTWGAERRAAGGGGCGVGFVMPVTQSYFNLGPSDVWDGPPSGEPVLGYHAQPLMGYDAIGDAAPATVWGSWGTSWASGGFGRITWRFIRACGSQLFVVTGGPTL